MRGAVTALRRPPRPERGTGVGAQRAGVVRPWVLVLAAALAFAYLGAAGGLLWWAGVPRVVGWEPRVVLTGSMEPVLRPGDVVLVAPVTVSPKELPPGRVLLVDDPERPAGTYLHRLVRYDEAGLLVTRGDANASEDNPAVAPGRVLGQVRLAVPLVGLPSVWLRSGEVLPLVALTAGTWGAVVVGASALRRPGPRRRALVPRVTLRGDARPAAAGLVAGAALGLDGADDGHRAGLP